MNMVCKSTALALAILAIAGCSNDDSNGDTYTPANVTGRFIDSAVSNLKYTSSSNSGFTEINGGMSFTNGETVTFSIGDVTLGSGYGRNIMTPLHLASELGSNVATNSDHVTNIVRTLVIADSDENPNNGIQINDAAHTALTGFSSVNFDQTTADFEGDAVVASMISRLVAAKGIAAANLTYANLAAFDAASANTHLSGSLAQEQPIVVHSYPAPEATDVPVDARIEVVFAQAIDKFNLSQRVELTSGDNTVSANVSASDNIVTLKPAAALQENTRYTVTLKAGLATDTNFGLALTDDVSWTFKTGSSTTNGPMQVVDLDVAVANSRVTAKFRAIDSASGEPITDAVDTDFDVYENDLKLFEYNYHERFKSFTTDPNYTPAHNLYIAIDISDSISTADLTRFKTMANELLIDDSGFSRLDDYQRVYLIPFDSRNSVSTNSTDPLSLKNELEDAAGDFILDNDVAVTDLFGAVNTFLTAASGAEPYEAYALVVFSDGVESAWNILWNDLEQNNVGGAVIYTVTTETGGDPDGWLDMLGNNQQGVTGLMTSTTPILAGIQDQLAQVEAVANSYYQISYETPVKASGDVDFILTVVASGQDKTKLGDRAEVNITAPNQTSPSIKLVDNATKANDVPLLVSPTGTLTFTAVTANGPVPASYSAVTANGNASVSVVGDQITLSGITAGTDSLTVNNSDGESLVNQSIYIANVYDWDFEASTLTASGWTSTGGWVLRTDDADSGTQSVASSAASTFYGNSLSAATPDSAITSPALDLTNYPINVTLSYSFKFKPNRVNTTGDTLLVQYSTNNGTTWNTLSSYAGYVGTWTDSSFTIPNTTDLIRFALNTDATDAFEGAFIDKVFITP